MQSFLPDIDECINHLNKGNLILYPTDTIWGIGCDAMNENAVEKIYKLKKRSDEKAMIVLVAHETEVMKYVKELDRSLFDYFKKMTKPTTVIYNNAIGLANNLIAKDGSIGMRVCYDEFCSGLMKKFGKPIVSTSANISGKPFPRNFSEISDEIKSGVDYIVQYRQEDKTPVEPSSIVRWNSNGTVTVLRQ